MCFLLGQVRSSQLHAIAFDSTRASFLPVSSGSGSGTDWKRAWEWPNSKVANWCDQQQGCSLPAPVPGGEPPAMGGDTIGGGSEAGRRLDVS